MEEWKIGNMQFWNFGMMENWNDGKLEIKDNRKGGKREKA